MNSKILMIFFIFFLIFGCVEEPTGEARTIIQQQQEGLSAAEQQEGLRDVQQPAQELSFFERIMRFFQPSSTQTQQNVIQTTTGTQEPQS